MTSIKQNGFSLVELSIVLVIVGLLVGGMLTGQSLMKAAQMRKLIKAQENYQMAFRQFRDKYFALPGDFSNATALWGRRQSSAWCITNSGAAVNGTGTCDGNGDSSTTQGSVLASEGTFAWEQLSLAGLVEERFAYVGGHTEDSAAGVLYPGHLGPDNASIWVVCYSAGSDCPSGVVWQQTGHFLRIAKAANGTTGLGWGGVRVDDAWNMDTKIDDGRPTFGRMLSQRVWIGTGSPCSGVPATELCVQGNPSAHTPSTQVYQVSAPAGECSMCISHIKMF